MTDHSTTAGDANLNAQLLRQILRLAPVGVVIASTDHAGEILYTNDAFTAITGYRHADVPDIPSWLAQAYPDQQYRAQVLSNWQRDVTDVGRDVVYTIQCKNGTTADVLLRANTLDPERMVVTLVDVSERTRAERALRESEARFRDQFEHALHGIALHEIITDAEGRPTDYIFLAVNRAFEALTGLEREAIVGRRVTEVLPGIEHDPFIEIYGRVALTGEPIRFEQYSSPLKKHYDIQAYSPAKGQFVAAFVDITERVLAEEARRKLEARVQHADKIESLAMLAGGVAHDFNNLLLSIVGNVDLLALQFPPTSPVHTKLANIRLATAQATDLARQMLAYSGKGRATRELLELGSLVGNAIPMLRATISDKALLRVESVDCRKLLVEADKTQVQQVLLNLVTNAAEAMADGIGTVTIACRPWRCDEMQLDASCWCEGTATGEYCAIEVADTGTGMSRETVASCFDPFFSTKFVGRGLGLAAVMGIVKAHRGTIQIESEPGRGTTVRILLPVAVVSASLDQPQPAHSAAAKRDVAEPETLCKGTVLVVDDEALVRDVAGKMLRSLGYAVVTAQDGREAISRFAEGPDGIACVLLDLSMPDMSGLAVFPELQRIRPNVPILLTSGYQHSAAPDAADASAQPPFIQKPYSLDELGRALKKAIEG